MQVKKVMKRLSGQLAQVLLLRRVSFLGQVFRLLEHHVHPGLQAAHQQSRRHAFAGHIADHDGDAPVGILDEVVIVAADGARGDGFRADVQALYLGRGTQQPFLDERGLLHLLGHGALGFFDFVQPRVLDTDGRDVGHHRQQVQVFAREFANRIGRIHVDQPDHAVVGLQRHGDHAANFPLDDAHVLPQSLVELGIAHQQGGFFLEHPVANGGGDLEAFAARRLHVELVAVERHQDAASGHHGLDRQVHDQRKQLRQRTVSGQLASGADQRPHLRAALHHGGLVEIVRLRAQDSVEAGDHGGGALRKLLRVVHEHDGFMARLAGAGEFDGQVPGRNPIARRKRHRVCRCGRRSAAFRSCCPDPPRSTCRRGPPAPGAGAIVRYHRGSSAHSRWSGRA